jgi:hypothetical protein
MLAVVVLSGAAIAAPASPQVPASLRGVVTDGIRLNGEARSVQVAQGMPVVVTGTLTNLRTTKIALATTDPLGGFRFLIHGPSGKVLKINVSGSNLIKLERRSRQQLAPNESTQQSVWIGSLYDLKQPGKYSITLSHAVPSASGLGEETIRSNAFFVVITKANH